MALKLTIDYRDDTTAIVTNAVGHAATYTLEPVGDGRRRVVAITGEEAGSREAGSGLTFDISVD